MMMSSLYVNDVIYVEPSHWFSMTSPSRDALRQVLYLTLGSILLSLQHGRLQSRLLSLRGLSYTVSPLSIVYRLIVMVAMDICDVT
jgi:hypothetical protein